MNVNIDELKRKIIVKFPYFKEIIDSINYVYEDSQMISSTDNSAIYYNDVFCNYSEDEKLFILSHEIFHISFDHINRGFGKDQFLWNIVTDVVINARLVQVGMNMVDGGYYYEDAINYDVDTLYEKFLKEGLPDELKNKNAKEDFGCFGKAGEGNKENKKYVSIGESNAFLKNKILKQEMISGLKNNLVKEMMSSKRNLDRDIDATNNVDWRVVLEDSLSGDMDWTYQNATIEYGVLIPNYVELNEKKCEILIDVSGSVNDNLLKGFLSEVLGLLRYGNVSIGFFDTKFYGFTNIYSEYDIDNLEIVGRGGTNFLVAMEAFSRDATNRVIFTDGKSIVPDIDMDVLWIIYGNNKDFVPNPGGSYVYVDVNDLVCGKGR